MVKYYFKQGTVRSHNRFDPRVKRNVNVHSYSRNQRYRNYETISMIKARELFNQKSAKAKNMDLSKTSKKVLEEPTEEWAENMGKSDVKGIDDFFRNDHEKNMMTISYYLDKKGYKITKITKEKDYDKIHFVSEDFHLYGNEYYHSSGSIKAYHDGKRFEIRKPSPKDAPRYGYSGKYEGKFGKSEYRDITAEDLAKELQTDYVYALLPTSKYRVGPKEWIDPTKVKR